MISMNKNKVKEGRVGKEGWGERFEEISDNFKLKIENRK